MLQIRTPFLTYSFFGVGWAVAKAAASSMQEGTGVGEEEQWLSQGRASASFTPLLGHTISQPSGPPDGTSMSSTVHRRMIIFSLSPKTMSLCPDCGLCGWLSCVSREHPGIQTRGCLCLLWLAHWPRWMVAYTSCTLFNRNLTVPQNKFHPQLLIHFLAWEIF